MPSKLGDLNERQLATLQWLGEKTDVHPVFGEHSWSAPNNTALACNLAFRLRDLGLNPVDERRRDYWNVNACANTLSALKRRGLASNDGGGVFLQANWWITPAGAELLAETSFAGKGVD